MVKKRKLKPAKPKIYRTVQEVLDFTGITPDGIIIAGNNYSKLYHLIDSNFVTEPDSQAEDIPYCTGSSRLYRYNARRDYYSR